MNSLSDFFYVMYLVDGFQLPMKIEEMESLKEVARGFYNCRALMLNSISVLNGSTENGSYQCRLISTSPKHHSEYYS
ncbi:hypothetical protein PS15m_000503 [Mucor circinelloides]